MRGDGNREFSTQYLIDIVYLNSSTTKSSQHVLIL